MAKVVAANIKTSHDAWLLLMSAVAEQAVLDWLKYRGCDIENREQAGLRNDALNFIRGGTLQHDIGSGRPKGEPQGRIGGVGDR